MDVLLLYIESLFFVLIFFNELLWKTTFQRNAWRYNVRYNSFDIECGQKGVILHFKVLFILHHPSTKYRKLNPSFPVRAALFCFNSNVSNLYNNSVVK